MAVAKKSGLELDVVKYMKDKPTEATLRAVIERLEDPVENLVRKDMQFKKLKLNPDDYVDNPDAVVEVLLKYPRLMQRPVLVRGDRAIIGRPLGKAKGKARVTEFVS